MTPGDPNDVNQLILVKDCRDRNSLLQMLLCPVHLVRNVSPIELDLRDVGLFLIYRQQSHLEKEKLSTATEKGSKSIMENKN